jgi:hypothetical protein
MGQPGAYGTILVPDAANAPKALEGAVSWADGAGNLWVFGGGGGSGYTDFNDLWKFDTGTGLWTWMNGDATINQPSSYPATVGSNNPPYASGPGARQYSATWTEIGSGGSKLWMFGGYVRTDANGHTAYANDMWNYDTSLDQWTWVAGSSSNNQLGTYGTKGTGATSNIPGARWGSAVWKDGSGGFWMFGGKGYVDFDVLNQTVIDGYYNDLWKYDSAIGEWTWVSGTNLVDQLETYGTKGTGATTNIPGGRSGAVSWTDSTGKLWLFGGYRLDSGGANDFNDLWQYDPANGKWTWVSGSNAIDQRGTYGTAGTGATGNIPGGRHSAIAWKDNSGNFWLFGGRGYDATGQFGELSDLWKYNPTSNQWTWMSGSNTIDQVGHYGVTPGLADPDNLPPSRDVAVSWYDSNGKFWMFGGQGVNALGFPGYYNDLWQFEVAP